MKLFIAASIALSLAALPASATGRDRNTNTNINHNSSSSYSSSRNYNHNSNRQAQGQGQIQGQQQSASVNVEGGVVAPGLAVGQCGFSISAGLGSEMSVLGLSFPTRNCAILSEADALWRMGHQQAALTHLGHNRRIAATYRAISQGASSTSTGPGITFECVGMGRNMQVRYIGASDLSDVPHSVRERGKAYCRSQD